ncbi:AMP-binding protein [Nostoc sp. CENA67]|uniref:AMP-binding protein n=1 Tax=Amazonocrinis nigriterrae CENA67 TaxID=2794033 RepID=A0A8J7HX17_9NOST|nr:AMP-binding protein [Amazonocrinis nigriterrae]MBH8565203.1 AMP-binding protein [Amazonocrinis nigriterrae CENA67]
MQLNNFANFNTLVDLLNYRAYDQPDQVAFRFLKDGDTETSNLTYQQLDRQSRAIATQLQSRNAIGERALLIYPPGLEFITSDLAISRINTRGNASYFLIIIKDDFKII